MAIKTTRWSLDTCECIIDYEWDDSLPNDQITLTPINIVNVCREHQKLPVDTTIEGFYSVLTEENPRKNQAIQHILDNGPSTIYDLVGSNKVKKLGVDIAFAWSGTAPDRVLHIVVRGVTLTTNQKNVAQNALNNKFGIGKVVIDDTG